MHNDADSGSVRAKPEDAHQTARPCWTSCWDCSCCRRQGICSRSPGSRPPFTDRARNQMQSLRNRMEERANGWERGWRDANRRRGRHRRTGRRGDVVAAAADIGPCTASRRVGLGAVSDWRGRRGRDGSGVDLWGLQQRCTSLARTARAADACIVIGTMIRRWFEKYNVHEDSRGVGRDAQLHVQASSNTAPQ
jgi:hypothetical protein